MQSTLLSISHFVVKRVLGAATYHMTEYCPLIGVQYPVRRGQQLNTQFIRPFPPCGSGLACETSLLAYRSPEFGPENFSPPDPKFSVEKWSPRTHFLVKKVRPWKFSPGHANWNDSQWYI